ncbi:hypothetical protein HZA97_05195 [Candidatus Woesearchaeota archaeon]|nr:hypothetical protein [Candidatus Woesearchaeota archaeon]
MYKVETFREEGENLQGEGWRVIKDGGFCLENIDLGSGTSLLLGVWNGKWEGRLNLENLVDTEEDYQKFRKLTQIVSEESGITLDNSREEYRNCLASKTMIAKGPADERTRIYFSSKENPLVGFNQYLLINNFANTMGSVSGLLVCGLALYTRFGFGWNYAMLAYLMTDLWLAPKILKKILGINNHPSPASFHSGYLIASHFKRESLKDLKKVAIKAIKNQKYEKILIEEFLVPTKKGATITTTAPSREELLQKYERWLDKSTQAKSVDPWCELEEPQEKKVDPWCELKEQKNTESKIQ